MAENIPAEGAILGEEGKLGEGKAPADKKKKEEENKPQELAIRSAASPYTGPTSSTNIIGGIGGRTYLFENRLPEKIGAQNFGGAVGPMPTTPGVTSFLGGSLNRYDPKNFKFGGGIG